MPLRTIKLLDIARDLYNSKVHEEEYYRSSTNRAYYCIFHQCSETAITKLGTTPKNDNFGHDELLRVFNSHHANPPTRVDRDIWRIAYLLGQVKDLRVEADYILMFLIRNPKRQTQSISQRKLLHY
ncbi:Uncharacterised protein [Legionella donaldsonii]|uniref:HEPN domain-containing protein n=1 Tax=Legionella donaldsonii TaxID=45060 RepID=A0A378J913_9GAMM|nr:Uncharacterised protein [Legionella donaldsonii]